MIEDDDSEETQVSAAVTEPFAGQVREMQLTELLQGLLAVADSVKASADDDGEEEEVGQRVREDRGGEGELGHEAVDELDHLVTGV